MDQESSPEYPHYHVFSDALTSERNPFEDLDEMSLKFVRISPSHLQEVAQEKGWMLSPDQRENGIVVVGTDAEYHWQLVSGAIETSDRTTIRESHSYMDSGFMMGWPGESEVKIYGGSAELNDENGKIFSDLSQNDLEILHNQTAQMLNTLYSQRADGPLLHFSAKKISK